MNYANRYRNNFNSMVCKFPIKKCMGKIAVKLKSHGESGIAWKLNEISLLLSEG